MGAKFVARASSSSRGLKDGHFANQYQVEKFGFAVRYIGPVVQSGKPPYIHFANIFYGVGVVDITSRGIPE